MSSYALPTHLRLRRATPADAEALAEFNGAIHGDNPADGERLAAWTRALASGQHPSFPPEDFVIVEDTRTGRIASSLNHISQRWTYAGVEFGVGRPELVGTHPDYRRQGLVRAQFDLIHRWSQARGELVQAITGIPYYYRQFGYEMTLDLGGLRMGYAPQVPTLKPDEPEPYHLRPAQETDLAWLQTMYAQATQRSLVACLRDEALWRYEITTRPEKDVNRREIRVIETPAGAPVGLLAHSHFLWDGAVGATVYEVAPHAQWHQVTPSVVRYLWATGQQYAAQSNEACVAFRFNLGAAHPVYEIYHDRLPRHRPPYGWYLRVPDLVAFLRQIAPVLEHRLAQSLWAGISRTLTISSYRSGVQLVFEAGRLTRIDPCQPAPAAGNSHGDANFPNLAFLQLLFGHRTMDELEYAFVDCWVREEEVRPILNALFPKQASCVWPVD